MVIVPTGASPSQAIQVAPFSTPARTRASRALRLGHGFFHWSVFLVVRNQVEASLMR
jgi:hypothetical protein